MVLSWLIYRLTGSALWLGIITFVTQGTAFVASPVIGYIVDRNERRRLLIWIEVASMIQAFLLAALVFAGAIQIWEIAVLSAFLGVAGAFESTTRHSFAFDLVGKVDLPSAISLNSVTINLSRVVGPAIAGVILSAFSGGGEGWCFVINGLSFIAVIVCLMLMRESELHLHHSSSQQTAKHQGFLHQMTLGIRYVKNVKEIRNLLLFTTFMSFVGFPYSVIFPILATKTLHGDAHTLGWITAASGVGSLFGGLSSSRPRAGSEAIWRKILIDLFLLGVSYVVMGSSHSLILTVCASTSFGFFLMGTFPLVNTTIQSLVDDSLRGRVVSLYTMSFLGAGPLGSLAVGALADATGVAATTLCIGTLCMGAAIWGFTQRKPHARPSLAT